ncbi:hypothetical protein I7I51_04555 [Histoplasma capsulatum]|uniref:Uncharacterized protein n=1 Tax=Ajellomyces capsulatus TaxID=5037 RepID=A0A8A1ME04_AJECA|nr:hypothetical protein I7I51_04555 [Histoplasma capsulatum]
MRMPFVCQAFVDGSRQKLVPGTVDPLCHFEQTPITGLAQISLTTSVGPLGYKRFNFGPLPPSSLQPSFSSATSILKLQTVPFLRLSTFYKSHLDFKVGGRQKAPPTSHFSIIKSATLRRPYHTPTSTCVVRRAPVRSSPSLIGRPCVLPLPPPRARSGPVAVELPLPFPSAAASHPITSNFACRP